MQSSLEPPSLTRRRAGSPVRGLSSHLDPLLESQSTDGEADPSGKDKQKAIGLNWLRWDNVRQLCADVESSEWGILVASTCLKVLLFPAYRSTDFEVHRNWLAITHSLPITQWYYDTTSEWTLDYPPFFAYFEKLLSIPAYLIDPKIVDLNNLNYDSWSVIAYQRTTVLVTELVMAAALHKFIRGSVDPSIQRIISASLFLHPGWLIVDHIHFQYNGFMFGILLWSILMARNGNKLASGFLFAVLLNFKHIYMYIAPAYFIYLLRTYCLSPSSPSALPNSILSLQLQPSRFLTLANTVILVFLASLGPFLLAGQLSQVASRLFPFKRGLCHAYWAGNVWALVAFADRVLLKVASRLGLQINESGIASSSRGLVGDTVFAILPNVQPIHTFIITILVQVVFMVKLWRLPTYNSFVASLTLCGYASFLFGWHVHEKAVLLVLVPLSLLAAQNGAYFRTFMIASVAGIYGLFPLLFTPAETFVKVMYSLLWAVLVFQPLSKRVYEFPSSLPGVLLDTVERGYIAGFAILQAFVTLFPVFTSSVNTPSPPVDVHIVTRNETVCADGICSAANNSGSVEGNMEFLPLMLTSVYCAVGLVWAFLRLSWIYLREKE